MKRSVPKLKTDKDAEDFLDQDLSDLDFGAFKSAGFEFENKAARVNMRMPQSQLDAVKAEAEKRGVPYQRLMRELVQRGLESLRAG
ncbi:MULTISPECIES: CopG family antitoxin [unclassified Nitratireductor]|uniref:CopG family antitoxin n=1 Tax=unclassified Nitratireductor TaxID=2641084 RepID=UPI0025FEB685|nr:CopG family antitoxin [Nitratireductor sp.]